MKDIHLRKINHFSFILLSEIMSNEGGFQQNQYFEPIPLWLPEEEEYLRIMHRRCHRLSVSFKNMHREYKIQQNKLKLPSIIISSVLGVVSFGQTVFPEPAQRWVPIGVGGMNIVIAIINTLDSYLKVSEHVASTLNSHNALQKLADDIFCEIMIPTKDRDNSGIIFLRDCYTRYQQIVDSSPLIDSDLHTVPQMHELKNMGDEIEKKRGFSIFPRKTSRSTPPAVSIPNETSLEKRPYSLYQTVKNIMRKKTSEQYISTHNPLQEEKVSIEMNAYDAEGLPSTP